MVVVLPLLAVVFASPVRADEAAAARVRARGIAKEATALGRQGRFEEAIARFRDAERVSPRALHMCNIALAYTRLERWVEAHWHFVRCRDRWEAEESRPLEPWVAPRIEAIASTLAEVDAARVLLSVRPAGARVEIPSLAPGEQVQVGEVWLAFGTHQVVVSHPGYMDQTLTLEVADRSARTVVAQLVPRPPQPPPAEPVQPVAPDPVSAPAERDPVATAGPVLESVAVTDPSSSRLDHGPRDLRWLGWSGVGLAVAVGALGGGLHVAAVASSDRVEDLPEDDPGLDDELSSFRRLRASAIAGYGVAAVLLAASGVVLLKRRGRNGAPAVKARAALGGAMVSVEWGL